MTRFEYRIGWSASSVAAFHGESDWMPWGGDEDTAGAVEERLHDGGLLCIGLEDAISISGFEWWCEVREAEGAAA